MKNSISTEICKKCGACCKNYPFIELSTCDISSLEQLTALHVTLFTHAKGKAIEEYFLQFKKNGDCLFLNEESGNYSCGVYEARPGICKKYPAHPIQEELCCTNREKIPHTPFNEHSETLPAIKR